MKNSFGAYIIFFLLFLFNPLAGIGVSLFFALKTEETRDVIFFSFLVVLLLTAINLTKEFANDQLRYAQTFMDIPQYGLKSLLFSNEKPEYAYVLLNYIIYYLSGGSVKIFFAVVTIIIYGFLFKAVLKWGNYSETPVYMVVAGIMCVAFFTQFFTLSLHLIRQMIAVSVFFNYIILRLENNKFCWFFFVLAPLFHNSILLIEIITIIPFAYGEINVFRLSLLLGVVLLFSLGIPFLVSNVINEVGAEGYVIGRAAELEGAKDSSGSFSIFTLLLVMVPLIICSALKIIRDKEFSMVPTLCIMWCLIVLGLSYAPLAQYRFFFMSYFFIPFILPQLFEKKTVMSKWYCLAMVCFFFARFWWTLDSQNFVYGNTAEFIVCPYFWHYL